MFQFSSYKLRSTSFYTDEPSQAQTEATLKARANFTEKLFVVFQLSGQVLGYKSCETIKCLPWLELSLTLFPVVSHFSVFAVLSEFPQKHGIFFTRTRHLHTVTACVVVTNSTVCHEYWLETEANCRLLRQNEHCFHAHFSKWIPKRKNEERRKKKTAIVCAKKIACI